MKRFVQFLGAATLLLSFTQCSEDATTDSAPSVQGSVKLTASINETRTELSGNDVLWKSNDRLGLFCGTKFVNAPFTTTTGGTTSADFTGDPTDPSGSEAEVFYAYYPYSAHAVLEGSVVSGLSIPAVQTFATKSFATELCPMATSGADYSRLAFRTIGTVLKFQVTGQKNVTKIELTGNDGEALAGDYTIDFVGETPEMKFSGTETTLTLTCSEPVALNDASATEFYFVLPAGIEFTKGITVKVYTDDNAEPMVKEYASPLTTRPNKLVTVKAFTYSVPVTSIEEANEALSKGTSGVTITSTTDLTAPSTLEIPNAFGHGTSASVEIEQPVSTDLTISEKTTSDKELPETLSVEMETTASLIVDTPNLTVSLEGSYTAVEATTAENTLIVAKNTVIETLTVKKGNVKIYGTVGEIVNEGTGKIIRCIDAQDEVERTLADTRCDHILIEKPAGTLDFGGGTTTKQVCVEASVTIANLIVSPEKEHPVMVSGDNVKLTLDGVKLVCNAAKTYAVNCLDGANPDVTLSNSEIIALGTDCRAVSVVNTRATSDTSYITFDNTQARTSQTAIGNREYTADEIKYFTSRVADGNYYPRGISVGSTGGKVNIALRNNSCIEGFFYGINIAGITEPVDVAIDDSRLDGRAALNVHGQKCIFRVNRSTLVGRNYFGGPTEDFATVVLDRAVATSHSNTVTVADSEIYSYNKPQTATNHQYSIDIRSLHNTVELKGSTRLIEVGSTEYPARLNFMVCYDNSTDNVVNVDPGCDRIGKRGGQSASGNGLGRQLSLCTGRRCRRRLPHLRSGRVEVDRRPDQQRQLPLPRSQGALCTGLPDERHRPEQQAVDTDGLPEPLLYTERRRQMRLLRRIPRNGPHRLQPQRRHRCRRQRIHRQDVGQGGVDQGADAEKRSDPIERRCRDSGKMGRSAGRLHGRRYQCLGLPCRKRDDPRPGHVSHRRAGRRMDEYLAAECDGDGRELFGKGRHAHGRIRHRRFHGYDSAPEACGGLQYDPELQRREYLDHA